MHGRDVGHARLRNAERRRLVRVVDLCADPMTANVGPFESKLALPLRSKAGGAGPASDMVGPVLPAGGALMLMMG